MELWIALGVFVVAAAGLLVLLRWRGRAAAQQAALPGGPTWGDTRDTQHLLASFDLQERTTGFFGRWLETQCDGERVAFRIWQRGLEIFAGAFDADREPRTQIELVQVSETRALPRDGALNRLDPFVGAEHPLSQRFFFGGEGEHEDYPQLHNPKLREALLALSPAVEGAQIYAGGGVELFLILALANREIIEGDVRQAVHVVKSLQAS
jgi:hypothetical protein